MTKREKIRRGSALTVAAVFVVAGTAFVGSDDPRVVQAGLIRSLRETDKYMKAVPARTAKLDRVLG